MTLDEFRGEMDAYRQYAGEQADHLKDSQYALELLEKLYKKFDAKEKNLADQVIIEWLQSDDENPRFDALYLIDVFKIAGSLAALQALAHRLESIGTPGAPYEARKVQRILARLSNP